MAKYCELSNFQDSLITGNITDETLSKADAYVDSLLNQIGVEPTVVNPSGYPILKQLAVYFASYLTALELSSGENDVYLQKAKAYKELYEKLEKRLIEYGLRVQTEDETETASFTIKLTRG